MPILSINDEDDDDDDDNEEEEEEGKNCRQSISFHQNGSKIQNDRSGM